MEKPRTYQITLTTLPNCREEKQIRGLRWLLKRVLRDYGLRCVRIDIKRNDCAK